MTDSKANMQKIKQVQKYTLHCTGGHFSLMKQKHQNGMSRSHMKFLGRASHNT
jgi:hypothetical protein